MANLSQLKREKMLDFLKKIKAEHQDDETLMSINEIENTLTEKKYGLVWEEHTERVDEEMVHNIPIFTEIEDRKIKNLESNDYNFLIEGDNLHSLKLFEKTHRGKIDVIYIDPPYNTGNKDFKYNDSFVEKTDEYSHSKWLSFMSKRLELARNLLSEEGVIFISIDDKEQAQLKLLCDEIFGKDNFIANITRNTNSSKNQSLYISISHEYCLVYSKNDIILAKKHKEKKWEVDKNNIDEYKKRIKRLQKMNLSNEEITEELKELTNYPRFIDFTNYWYVDERGVYQKDNLGGVKNGNMNSIINPLTGKEDPIPPGGFRYKAEKLEELIKDNRIHFHTDGSLPRLKRYLDENLKQRPKSIMSDDQRPDFSLLKKLNIEFDNPKQMTFMTRILSIFEKNSTFLDFFAGSGTTGHAVMQLNKKDGGNRKYILCTNNENNICEEVTYQRLSKIQEELPHNLKYFKTEFIPKFSENEESSIKYQMLNHVKELIELEYMCEIDGINNILIKAEEEFDEIVNENMNENIRLFVSSDIFASKEQQLILEQKNIEKIEIPEYYYRSELREVGEL
ncbi:site-specific DNA-methyltransferase [Fusobacterium varium]|uniref:site-specific DNA-methyltransferase n=1 Tax=Fusobacterium varium TaxID=856 RepID=UPI0022E61AB8|nr:site-specific DNA-methyltransferase [Fusobacterium varium]